MKAISKTICTLLLTLFICVCSGQDIITLKNGNEVKAKVTEIEKDAIKYKKFDNLNGPVYSFPKAEVFTIQYENGTKDIITAVTLTPVNPSAEQKVAPATPSNQPGPTNYSNDKNSKYKREIVGGAVMTGLSAPCIATGGTLCAIGAVLEAPTEEFDIYGNMKTTYHDGEGMPLWLPGAILSAAGVAMLIAGPIQLSKGIRHRKEFKYGRAFIDFKPVNDQYFDAHLRTMTYQKLGAVTLHF